MQTCQDAWLIWVRFWLRLCPSYEHNKLYYIAFVVCVWKTCWCCSQIIPVPTFLWIYRYCCHIHLWVATVGLRHCHFCKVLFTQAELVPNVLPVWGHEWASFVYTRTKIFEWLQVKRDCFPIVVHTFGLTLPYSK